MKYDKILVLGDCIATGQNCLIHNILEQEDCLRQDFNLINDKKEQAMLGKWYLINRDKTIKMNKKTLFSEAFKFKREQEKLVAWPTYLNAESIVNLCVSGESFMGMTVKLKKYLENNKMPDLVLITDIARTHYCYYTNYEGKKIPIKRDISFVDEDQHLYPPTAYKKFQKSVDAQVKQGEKYWIKKNNRLIKILENNLKTFNLNYEYVFFRSISKNFLTSRQPIESYHLLSLYTDSDQSISTKKKLETQQIIAELVNSKI